MVWRAWCCCLHGRRSTTSDAHEMTPLMVPPKSQVSETNAEFARACVRGDAAAVRTMVEGGAIDVKARGKLLHMFESNAESRAAHLVRVSPLFCAVEVGNAQIVKLLLDAGADARRSIRFNRGEMSVLHMASSDGHVDVVRLLLQAGVELEKRGEGGRTALLLASLQGHLGVVKLLLKAGADVASTDYAGNTPLVDACVQGHAAVVKALLVAGADANATNLDGDTPLWRASGRGHSNIVTALLDAGADVNATDKGGDTTLGWAGGRGHPSVVKILLDAGADVNAANKDGDTPLGWASRRGHAHVVRVLLDAGADVNAANKFGASPIHLASSDDVVRLLRVARAAALMLDNTPFLQAFDKGHLKTVLALLDVGVDVNEPYEDGETLLFRAFRLGHGAFIKPLLDRGADVNLENAGGETLLFNAAARGEAEIAKLLLNAGANVNSRGKGDETPLFRACAAGHTEVVKVLRDHGALVNPTNSSRETALFCATRGGHSDVVRLLVASGAVTSLVNTNGETPLVLAASRGHVEIVKILRDAGSLVDASAQNGQTALHHAGNAEVAAWLLATEASPHTIDWGGNTPLHEACRVARHDVAVVLLDHGADVKAENKSGFRPLHCVLFTIWREPRLLTKQGMLKMIQVLVLHGAAWDDMCEAIMTQKVKAKSTSIDDFRWRKEAPAIRVCVRRWMNEFQQGFVLTHVPIEEVRRGATATTTYLHEITVSRNIVYRRKVCVVGPSNWGKTSLIKSLLAERPSLVHPDDRTIGIDQFKLVFEDRFPELKTTKRHEVTYWDFAGQDAYQTTHSLFFSARTLFVVVVDLESYNIARMQAELMTDFDTESDKWLNEFIDTRVLRWIRLIFACQPDAEFVFIATKKDRLLHLDEADEDGTVQDLVKRLENVMVIVEDMKTAFAQRDHQRSESSADYADPLLITRLGDPRLKQRVKRSLRIIVSSCVAAADVDLLQTAIRDVIRKSDRGYPMADKYTLVLMAVVQMRMDAARLSTDKRLPEAFMDIGRLLIALQDQVKSPDGPDGLDSDKPYLDEVTCRTILQTLRDLGDVLWYEDIEDTKLQRTVILDPLLLIDFVRQVITHKHTAETMPHSKLKGLPFWLHLDHDSMTAMKRVLQHFNLVHPTVGDMDWDTDLIVPAYWKANTCAFWKFGGDILRLGRDATEEDLAVRVHWEFHFPIEFPDSLFDNLVVTSYAPTYTRDVGPDWILYEVEGVYACRIVIGRDHATHERSLHVEAALACSGQAKARGLWMTFEHLGSKLGFLLRRYQGLPVSSFARTRANVEHGLRSVLASPISPDCEEWMPPAATWPVYESLVAKRAT